DDLAAADAVLVDALPQRAPIGGGLVAELADGALFGGRDRVREGRVSRGGEAVEPCRIRRVVGDEAHPLGAAAEVEHGLALHRPRLVRRLDDTAAADV